MIEIDDLSVRPLTPDVWEDFEGLFGEKGAYGGCWCMWWRITRREFEQNQGAGNRKAMKDLVDAGIIPGLIAYSGDTPCGWCSVAPREDFASLERSRVLKRIDERPVWSIVCFFIDKEYRGRGVIEKLIRGAIDYAQSRGAAVVEAYPTVVRGKPLPPVSSYMGIPRLFERVGFKEVKHPSASKVIMRYELLESS